MFSSQPNFGVVPPDAVKSGSLTLAVIGLTTGENGSSYRFRACPRLTIVHDLIKQCSEARKWWWFFRQNSDSG